MRQTPIETEWDEALSMAKDWPTRIRRHGSEQLANMPDGRLDTVGGSFYDFDEPDYDLFYNFIMFCCAENHSGVRYQRKVPEKPLQEALWQRHMFGRNLNFDRNHLRK